MSEKMTEVEASLILADALQQPRKSQSQLHKRPSETDRVPFHFTDAELDLGREELHHHLPPPHRLHLALSQQGQQGRRRRPKRPLQSGGQEEGRRDAARDRRQGRLIRALG